MCVDEGAIQPLCPYTAGIGVLVPNVSCSQLVMRIVCQIPAKVNHVIPALSMHFIYHFIIILGIFIFTVNHFQILNPLSPHDALKHHFTSLRTDLIFLQLMSFRRKKS